jgi:ABC transporter substrate binding protein
VAARGPRAGGDEAADHRTVGREHAFGREPMGCRLCAAVARTRLDRGSHRRDRVSLGRGTRRARRRDRGRVRPAQGRCDCHLRNHTSPRGEKGDFGHTNRPCDVGRSAWHRPRHESGATGRQRHGVIASADLAGKRLELLRELVPGLRTLAILANVGSPNAVLDMREVRAAAGTLGLEVIQFEIRRAEDIARGFEALKGRANALFIATDPLLFTNRARIHTLAMSARLPAIYPYREYVDAGGLMSYGPNFPDQWRRTAGIVDKILRGAKPSDIPVEQPTKFDLVINLTTAKALRLEVPPTLLARADEVIE